MDPKLIALVATALLLLAVCVVRSDRALSQEHKQARRKQFDSHGHE